MTKRSFAAEYKIRELKTRISKLNAQKLNIKPTKTIHNSAQNMNLMKSVKYGLSPEKIKKFCLAGERFKTVFNMHRLEKTKKLHDRLKRYDQKRYTAKRKKLREDLMINEKVLVLAKRIKKKAAPDKFYKQSAQNISYFNKNKTFTIRKIEMIGSIKY